MKYCELGLWWGSYVGGLDLANHMGELEANNRMVYKPLAKGLSFVSYLKASSTQSRASLLVYKRIRVK